MRDGSTSQYVCIGSGNGLVLNKQQAIAWTNDDPDQWHQMPLLSHN